MFWENCKLAFASIKANKMRSFLTMLGIIIGISSVIAIMTVGNSLTQSVQSQMSTLGSQNISCGVMQTDYDEEISESVYESAAFSTDTLEKLVTKFNDQIEAVAVSSSLGSGTVGIGNDTAKVSVTGVSAGYFKANSIELSKGAFFGKTAFDKGSNVALISEKLVESNYDGDSSKILGQQMEVNINDSYQTYTIVGVYEDENSSSIFGMGAVSSTTVYVPLKTVWNQTHDSTIYDFTVLSKDGTDSTILASDMQTYLGKITTIPEGMEIECYSMQSAISTMTSIMSSVTLAISMIAAIALLVGGIGVMNIMTVSITERTKEIGTRKALGAQDRHIMFQFITEAIILCMIGGIIGLILGLVIGNVASSLMGYAAAVSIKSILISLGFSTAIGVFFGYYPAKRAANMNPIDALRYE